MDFRSPEEVVDALRQRCGHGIFGYTKPYKEVEDAVLDYLQARHGLKAERDWLVWMPGVVPALNLVCRAYAETGEGIMTMTPAYPPFLSAPQFSGRMLQKVPLCQENDIWRFDWDLMEKTVTEKTQVFMLCNPQNPTGRVFSRPELELVLAFCSRHDLVLCSDEIHCDLILDNVEHVSGLSLGEGAEERTLVLLSASKTYNLAGLACAYAVIADQQLRGNLKRAAQGVITEINAFGYAGCESAYRAGGPWRSELLEQLRANRDVLYKAVSNMPGLSLVPMQATYLAWIDARKLPVKSPHTFFESHGVGLSDGADFSAPGFLRLNFGCPSSQLEEALGRMTLALETLRQ